MTALIATAFTAGLVATVNPCGFAMLPAYLGYFLGAGDTRGGVAPVSAFRVGGIVSLGFLTVFGVAGVVIVAGVRSVVAVIPWAALVVGGALLLMGITSLRGRYFSVRLPQLASGQKQGSMLSVFGFGVSYAVASLSCTLPIFLSLVAGTFTHTSFVGGVAAFLAYGLGMSTVLMAITMGMALGRDAVIRRLRRLIPHMTKISGLVMVFAGGFIVWYWATILSQGAVTLGGNGVVRFVDQLSASVTNALSARPWLTAAVAAIGVGLAALRARGRSREH